MGNLGWSFLDMGHPTSTLCHFGHQCQTKQPKWTSVVVDLVPVHPAPLHVVHSPRPPALFISCMCSRLPAAASVCQALVVNQVKLSASLAAVSVSHLHFAQLLCSSVFGPMTLRPLAPPTKSVSLSLLSARILRASADLPQLLPPSPPADLLSRI